MFSDRLRDLIIAAELHHGRTCVVLWRYDLTQPPREAWQCWIEHAPTQRWIGESGIAAMTAALETLRVL